MSFWIRSINPHFICLHAARVSQSATWNLLWTWNHLSASAIWNLTAWTSHHAPLDCIVNSSSNPPIHLSYTICLHGRHEFRNLKTTRPIWAGEFETRHPNGQVYLSTCSSITTSHEHIYIYSVVYWYSVVLLATRVELVFSVKCWLLLCCSVSLLSIYIYVQSYCLRSQRSNTLRFPSN